MPRIIYTETAIADLVRLRDFLKTRSPEASKRAVSVIRKAIETAAAFPERFRPVPDLMHYREIIIDFGSSGYIAPDAQPRFAGRLYGGDCGGRQGSPRHHAGLQSAGSTAAWYRFSWPHHHRHQRLQRGRLPRRFWPFYSRLQVFTLKTSVMSR